MTPSANLSPRSVLHFSEDYVSMDDVSSLVTRRGEKRKLCLSLPSNGEDTVSVFHDKSPRMINLRHRLICDQTIEWLAGKEQALEGLWLGPVFESSKTMFTAIETLPVTLTHLDLDLRNELHLLPEIMPLLFRRSHLTSLSIRLVGDSGAIELAKWIHLNPNLKKLDLRENRISSEGIRAVARAILTHNLPIEHLDLSWNCIVDVDPIRELLFNSRSLTSLDLGFNWIGNEEVERLCHGLRRNSVLQRLYIFGCQRVNQQGIKSLINCLHDDNTTLQHVEVQAFGAEAASLQQRMLHFLALNRAGRVLFERENAGPSPLWPRLFSKQNLEPTTLYQMLQQGGRKLYNL